MKTTIEQIDRVQNPHTWMAYNSKKAILDLHLPARGKRGGANEQEVFHGGAAKALSSIVRVGFDRDYSVAAAYGKGSYFARDASYSAGPRYAKPDASGKQRVLLVRVLAGEPCCGRSGGRPTSKADGTLHESMVDDLANPSIFVLGPGTDDHAYPTHLITFTRK